jgi:hypothetical protein
LNFLNTNLRRSENERRRIRIKIRVIPRLWTIQKEGKKYTKKGKMENRGKGRTWVRKKRDKNL